MDERFLARIGFELKSAQKQPRQLKLSRLLINRTSKCNGLVQPSVEQVFQVESNTISKLDRTFLFVNQNFLKLKKFLGQISKEDYKFHRTNEIN